jgi:LacI family transcriptional regulator
MAKTPKTPTTRSLARQLRLSVATVSEALRDSPRVKPATKERVRRLAQRLGYSVNPLLGAALSAVRRSRHLDYRGTLALVDEAEDGNKELMLFHREIAAGATERAQSLGFNTELFWVGPVLPAVSVSRLSSMLFARGIGGVVLLPFNVSQDFSSFDFGRFAAVQMDHCLIQPRLHTVVPDHYVSMIHALERLTKLGYKRIGLCLERRKDERLLSKWSAGFLSFWRSFTRDSGIAPLIAPQLTQELFVPWFREHKPDLVMAHRQQVVEWMKSIGMRVPEDVGYFILNHTERLAPCAGLDLQPRRMGYAAVETVVGMMHRYEHGVPAFPQTITLEASWIEGPTLRKS